MGDYLFDTHSKPVHEQVWDLFAYKAPDLKSVPILIEWDEDLPDYPSLEKELLKAKKIWTQEQDGGAREIFF